MDRGDARGGRGSIVFLFVVVISLTFVEVVCCKNLLWGFALWFALVYLCLGFSFGFCSRIFLWAFFFGRGGSLGFALEFALGFALGFALECA